jgi:hypothetical protein
VILAEPVVEKQSKLTAHRFWVVALAIVLFSLIGWVAVHGFSYYRLPLTERPFDQGHGEFKPAGTTGIRLGILACLIFALIYIYPLRKKFKFLRFMGSTKHVLDFHIVMGLAVSPIVALHSAFKFRGLAGMAFWIMLCVVLSGIVGRYLYAQIPRSRKDNEFSFAELEQMRIELAAQLEYQQFAGLPEWEQYIAQLGRDSVRQMSLLRALFHMMLIDVRRPFQVAALRRANLRFSQRLLTFAGFIKSGNVELEDTIRLAKQQAWLSAKIFFLDRAAQIFKLWHVIHRPFSYAFLVLAIAHISMVMAMGYLPIN